MPLPSSSRRIVWPCAVALFWTTRLWAQQPASSDRSRGEHVHAQEAVAAGMFPAREASGTAWLPDETPMHGFHHSLGGWEVMLHGSAVGQYLVEPTDRHRTGGESTRQASSVNWLMLMARRPVAGGRVGVRTMLSAEPWTVRDCGFINLLANGEMCEGDTIHDRQHPHDLFMELAADYERALPGGLRWHFYGGLAGEPALGPAGFPHRPSALPNPVAPVTHHWLDSSHISFGLVTTGLSSARWRAEVSLFNGREPDAARADLDLGALDSVAGRLTWLPSTRWALQVSAGHLRAAEAEFPPRPRSDVDRATVSATYHRLSGTRTWASTLAYGVNAGREPDANGVVLTLRTHAWLWEGSLSLADRDEWFARGEVVGKAGHDLHIHEAPVTVFLVGKVQTGYVRWLPAWQGLTPGIGGTVSASILPSALAPRYSGRLSPGFGVFISVRPARHQMPARPSM